MGPRLVTVRFFAAVREAAGTAETTLPPGPLPELLTALESRYGPPFAERLAISTVLIDGTATPHRSPVVVPAGAEIALLPPVSGGAHPDDRHRAAARALGA